MDTLVVIVGPTGVGKTRISLALAQHLSCPILNADSRQIFAELPIGTAAPTPQQQSLVKHYFVGCRHLTDYYSAAMFEQESLTLLKHIFSASQATPPVAILSGGSMLYIDAVCHGIDDIPTIDDHTRTLLKARLEHEGLPALVEELKRLDVEHWKIVDKNNPRRVVHALEVCHATGKTYTSFRTNQRKSRPFRIIKIGLNLPREEMYNRINERVLQMMNSGLEAEARKVYPLRGLNALNTVGYKELFSYFDGNIPLAEAVRQIQSNTRQYMRKQLTWFKKDADIHWFAPNDVQQILDFVDGELRSIPTSTNN